MFVAPSKEGHVHFTTINSSIRFLLMVFVVPSFLSLFPSSWEWLPLYSGIWMDFPLPDWWVCGMTERCSCCELQPSVHLLLQQFPHIPVTVPQSVSDRQEGAPSHTEEIIPDRRQSNYKPHIHSLSILSVIIYCISLSRLFLHFLMFHFRIVRNLEYLAQDCLLESFEGLVKFYLPNSIYRGPQLVLVRAGGQVFQNPLI